jgi:hypothetical protein
VVSYDHKFLTINGARVAKLADAPDLGSGGEILRGSSPLPGISETETDAPTLDSDSLSRMLGVERWELDV